MGLISSEIGFYGRATANGLGGTTAISLPPEPRLPRAVALALTPCISLLPASSLTSMSGG